MIEKPDIQEEEIKVALKNNYSIEAVQIEFLPIGNDPNAFSYRVHTNDGSSYFLKVKTRLSNHAGLFVPRFLSDSGIKQVVAPLSTNTHGLWININRFVLILYPFIHAVEAMKVGMTDSQWMELGSTLKQIHNVKLPVDISQHIRHESFVPPWSNTVKELAENINTRIYEDRYQKQLALFWKENNDLIQLVLTRAETIGKRLQQTKLEFVLCHADIHTANIMLTQDQQMFIVDWDDTLVAPKERDLMFVLGDPAEEQLFFKGYGTADINQLALAYYGYEWCVQEIGDFGARVFLTSDTGAETKRNSVDEFMKLFSTGDVIEAAMHTPIEI